MDVLARKLHKPNRTSMKSPNAARVRFSFATFLWALLPALLATAIVAYFLARPQKAAKQKRADGMVAITLSQKDSSYRLIPPSAGGASANALFSPTGAGFHLRLNASGLKPARRYALELQVDGTIYTVASYVADAQGALALDTTLSAFQEGECVGRNYDPPRPVSGHHDIKIWMKHDGSPSAGTMPGIPPNFPGAQLSCHGDGDGDYHYVLLENAAAYFTGTPARGDSR
jgi:hypothetical protein